MNAVGLLTLIAAAAQVGVADPPPGNRDFGWQISPADNALEYIVQVSPEEAAQMQTEQLEYPSDMPPQLVGRVTRILFRIGNNELPRTPSLEEIERTIPRYNSPRDVTAALGPGRISELESDAVVNIQGGGMPPLPNYDGSSNQGSSLADLRNRALQAGENLIDQAGNRAQDFIQGSSGLAPPPATPLPGSTAGLGNRFLDATGGSPSGVPPGGFGTGDPATPSVPGIPGRGLPSTGQSRFENTAPPNTDASIGIAGNQGGLTGDAFGGRGGSTIAGGRVPLAPRSTAPPQSPPSYAPGTPPSLSGNNEFFAGVPRQQAPVASFGSVTAANPFPGVAPSHYSDEESYRRQYLANQRAQQAGATSPQYNLSNNYPNTQNVGNQAPGSQAGGNPHLLPNTQQPAAAANQGGAGDGVSRIASTSGAGLVGGGNASTETGALEQPRGGSDSGSPSDNNGSKGSPTPTNNSASSILQVFFLLSLVVNFYLGLLLRKLLTRYRSLLSNVRSQTA